MRGVFALAPMQIVQALAGLGAIAVFTRLMSAEEFGHYALALSVSMLAHTLLFTWAEAAAFRFLPAARTEGRTAEHFATLWAVSLGLGVTVLCVASAVLALVGVDEHLLALSSFAAGATVFRFYNRIARESDRAALAIGRYAALETVYLTIGFAAGVAILIQLELGAAAPFAGMLLAGGVVLLLDAPRVARQTRGGRVSLARAGVYAGYGAPLALALAIDLAVQTIARFVLAHQAGAGEVGAYAAAFGLARPLDLLFMAAGAALSPLLLCAYETEGGEGLQRPARHGIVLAAAVAIPAAAGLTLVAAPLSALLVGESLSGETARALPWLALAGLASGFSLYYLSEAFQLTRRTGLRALLMLAPASVQLCLTALLAGPLGATGAAVAAAAGASAGAIVLWLFGRKLVSLPLPLDELARIGAATALMAGAVSVLPPQLPLQVVVGVAAYALAAIGLNVAGLGAHTLAVARSRSHFFAVTERPHAH